MLIYCDGTSTPGRHSVRTEQTSIFSLSAIVIIVLTLTFHQPLSDPDNMIHILTSYQYSLSHFKLSAWLHELYFKVCGGKKTETIATRLKLWLTLCKDTLVQQSQTLSRFPMTLHNWIIDEDDPVAHLVCCVTQQGHMKNTQNKQTQETATQIKAIHWKTGPGIYTSPIQNLL